VTNLNNNKLYFAKTKNIYMRKIIIAIALMFGSVGLLYAQAPTTVTKETKKEKKEKTTSVQSNGLKKDGTPDMRLKANKTKVQTTTTTVQPTPKVTPAPQVNPTPKVNPTPSVVTTQKTTTTATTKVADKVIETDAKGRTIYQGPRGGKYYINKNGNKEYVK
jgi:colicin import membrane protein